MSFESYANRIVSLNEYYRKQIKPKKSCLETFLGKENQHGDGNDKKDIICRLERQEVLFL